MFAILAIHVRDVPNRRICYAGGHFGYKMCGSFLANDLIAFREIWMASTLFVALPIMGFMPCSSSGIQFQSLCSSSSCVHESWIFSPWTFSLVNLIVSAIFLLLLHFLLGLALRWAFNCHELRIDSFCWSGVVQTSKQVQVDSFPF